MELKPCPICGNDKWNGILPYEMTIFGITLKEWCDLREFAIQHGWNNCTDNKEIKDG